MTSQRATIPVALQPGTTVLRIERAPNHSWMLWLNTRDYIHGTFLQLYDDGMIERVTVRNDEGDSILLVKGPDKL